MERIYQVTPEMLGLAWPRLARLALRRSTLYVAGGILLSVAFHRSFLTWIAVSGCAADILSTFLLRLYAPSKLRLTESTIEEVDGPVIRNDTIVSVEQLSDEACEGLEVIGRRDVTWLPNYRIFVPAGIAGFEEVHQVLLSWVATNSQAD